ncbi:T9SS type A sorting domain-containing protein [Marinoscillum sp. MHG1-6]|uniref:T9SS type A sorting domain-containing protein n=1 Tax=Marinoscillum sp. MHG1-6 TaxID=2959627 RepID=UPI0021589813|nr:T9SS type A sorting domain-containing protein [Marinoscillum sp. MHG1-6]
MHNKLIIISFSLLFSLATYAQEASGPVISAENNLVVESLDATNKIELYPNPAVDYLIVSIKNSTLQNTEFELHSIIGNEIKVKPEEIGAGKYRISIKDYATGYYFLVVKDEFLRFKQAYKFLKK